MTDPSAGLRVGVVGLGAMGSQAALHLARRGVQVTGFDRDRPPHARGSSGGRTRIIREAYFEHPGYVPLVQEAYRLWAAQERDIGGSARLLMQTGGLMMGLPDSAVVRGALVSAAQHELPHEVLDARSVRRRFPVFGLPTGQVGVWEPRAGILLADACIATALALAISAGADLRFDEVVLAVTPTPESITIRTTRREVQVDRVVISAGPWVRGLVKELGTAITVTRQPVIWCTSAGPHAGPDRCPIWIWEWDPGRMVYGFPDLGDGAKLARHYEGAPVDPDTVVRSVAPEEQEALRNLVARIAPDLAGDYREGMVCLYSNMPDGHFLVDRLPGDPRIIVASPCSGHGFKFAPVIGTLVTGLALGDRPEWDVGMFGWRT